MRVSASLCPRVGPRPPHCAPWADPSHGPILQLHFATVTCPECGGDLAREPPFLRVHDPNPGLRGTRLAQRRGKVGLVCVAWAMTMLEHALESRPICCRGELSVRYHAQRRPRERLAANGRIAPPAWVAASQRRSAAPKAFCWWIGGQRQGARADGAQGRVACPRVPVSSSRRSQTWTWLRALQVAGRRRRAAASLGRVAHDWEAAVGGLADGAPPGAACLGSDRSRALALPARTQARATIDDGPIAGRLCRPVPSSASLRCLPPRWRAHGLKGDHGQQLVEGGLLRPRESSRERGSGGGTRERGRALRLASPVREPCLMPSLPRSAGASFRR